MRFFVAGVKLARIAVFPVMLAACEPSEPTDTTAPVFGEMPEPSSS